MGEENFDKSFNDIVQQLERMTDQIADLERDVQELQRVSMNLEDQLSVLSST